MRVLGSKPKAQEGRNKETMIPLILQRIRNTEQNIRTFTPPGFKISGDLRPRRRKAAGARAPTFPAARQSALDDLAKSSRSSEAASGQAQAPEGWPRSVAPRSLAAREGAGALAAIEEARRPFAAFQTDTVADEHPFLPLLASSARSWSEPTCTVCSRTRPLVPWSVTCSNK